MRCVAPTARIGGRVALKAPSQAKAFGLGVPKLGRKASQFKAMAFKVTLKTPDGDQEIECDGTPCCFMLRLLRPEIWCRSSSMVQYHVVKALSSFSDISLSSFRCLSCHP